MPLSWLPPSGNQCTCSKKQGGLDLPGFCLAALTSARLPALAYRFVNEHTALLKLSGKETVLMTTFVLGLLSVPRQSLKCQHIFPSVYRQLNRLNQNDGMIKIRKDPILAIIYWHVRENEYVD